MAAPAPALPAAALIVVVVPRMEALGTHARLCPDDDRENIGIVQLHFTLFLLSACTWQPNIMQQN